jgi:phosphoglycolate phosphatase-like HAD superfamily hydrolase
MESHRLFLTPLLTTAVASTAPALAAEPLPSWNEGPVKKSIVDFVAAVTRQGAPTFVPVAERIAVFDNDGTLWSEQPAYFQLLFIIDRVKALAPQHPEWKTTQPFKGAIAGDFKAVAATGEKGIAELGMVTHAGTTTEEFERVVRDWIGSARHPRFGRPYNEVIYQPMVELLGYLRGNGFKTYVVSGGGIEFMRAWVEPAYGIPPEQVVGSTIVTRFEQRDGQPVLVRDAKIDFIDDKAGKPVAINKFIGRRPIFAFGNSDGDLEMLQWTAAGAGARFMGIVHHTDADREWAYDRKSHVGQLDRALDEGKARGWTLVDMKRDWKTVYAFQR